MEFTKLIEDVLLKSKPVRPNCTVCGAPMQAAEWDSNGKELLVCSRIKPNNQQGDARVYDPQHYEKSKIRISIGVDLTLLRRNLAEAFGKVEAETEARILAEYRSQKTTQEAKPVEAKPAMAVTASVEASKPAKKKAETPA